MPAKTTKKTSKTKGKAGVDQRLVKALAHPLRVQILMILNDRMASPNELSKELDEGLSQVSYHVKVLKDFECIQMVKTEPRRGAVEHYYRATERAYFGESEWASIPDSIKPGMTASLLQMMMDDVVSALEGGTFHARDDMHISWTPGLVDAQGWSEMVDLMAEVLDKSMTIHSKSAMRLAKSSEEGIPASVVLMHFERIEADSKPERSKQRKAAKKKA